MQQDNENLQIPSNLASQSVEELNELGLQLLEKKDYSNAIKIFQHITTQEPLDSRLWFNLGVVYLKSQKLSSAKDIFEGLTLRRPDFALAWYYRGFVNLELQDLSEAIFCTHIAQKIDASYIQTLNGKIEKYSKLCVFSEMSTYSRWRVLAQLGKIDLTELSSSFTALTCPSKKFSADSITAFIKTISALQKQIIASISPQLRLKVWKWFADEVDADIAIAELQQLVADNATFMEGWLAIGQIAFRLQDIEVAENALKQVLEMDPQHHGAWSFLGALYMDSRQWTKAQEALEQATLLDPKNWQLLARLAKTLVFMVHHSFSLTDQEKQTTLLRAKTLIDRAILEAPDSVALFIRKAEITEALGDQTSMEQALQKALTIDPLDPMAQRLKDMLDSKNVTLGQDE